MVHLNESSKTFNLFTARTALCCNSLKLWFVNSGERVGVSIQISNVMSRNQKQMNITNYKIDGSIQAFMCPRLLVLLYAIVIFWSCVYTCIF